MAVFHAKSAIDMTFLASYGQTYGSSITDDHDATHFVTQADYSAYSIRATGVNFTYYSSFGDWIADAGTVHGMQMFESDINPYRLLYTLNHFTQDVVTFQNYVNTADWDGFFADVFSGRDTIYGSGKNDHLLGFGGNDTIKGNGGKDILEGDAGADKLTGGGSADRFDYPSSAQSTGAKFDRITDFNASQDKIGTKVAVTGIDHAVNHIALITAHFDSNLSSALNAAHLAKHHAVLATVKNAGPYANHTFLVVDTNGHAGYQHGDLVIDVTGMTGTLHTSDFVHL